ncbi:unnamed protein product [Brassica oleracea]
MIPRHHNSLSSFHFQNSSTSQEHKSLLLTKTRSSFDHLVFKHLFTFSFSWHLLLKTILKIQLMMHLMKILINILINILIKHLRILPLVIKKKQKNKEKNEPILKETVKGAIFICKRRTRWVYSI